MELQMQQNCPLGSMGFFWEGVEGVVEVNENVWNQIVVMVGHPYDYTKNH